MSRNLDAALAVLEGHDLQHSTEASYGHDLGEEKCWRCGSDVSSDSGLCVPCGEWLRCETDDDPADKAWWVAPYEFSSEAIRAALSVTYRDNAVEVGPCPQCGGEVTSGEVTTEYEELSIWGRERVVPVVGVPRYTVQPCGHSGFGVHALVG